MSVHFRKGGFQFIPNLSDIHTNGIDFDMLSDATIPFRNTLAYVFVVNNKIIIIVIVASYIAHMSVTK